jgi:hypothetical protein
MIVEGPRRKEYLAWKRKNVSWRGMKEVGETNGNGAMMGAGLYTAALTNRSMARQYGRVMLAVGAVPKNPKVVDTINGFEMFRQRVIMGWCKANGKDEYDPRGFSADTTLEDEVMKLGYDGIIIKGREMVNYKPESVRYFDTEDEVERYWVEHVKYADIDSGKRIE